MTENKTNERLLLSVTLQSCLEYSQNHFEPRVYRPGYYWSLSLAEVRLGKKFIRHLLYLHNLEGCYFRLLAIGVQTLVSHIIPISKSIYIYIYILKKGTRLEKKRKNKAKPKKKKAKTNTLGKKKKENRIDASAIFVFNFPLMYIERGSMYIFGTFKAGFIIKPFWKYLE